MDKNTMSEAIRPALEQMRRAQDEFSASNAAKTAEYSAVFHRDLPYLDDGLADHLPDVVTPARTTGNLRSQANTRQS